MAKRGRKLRFAGPTLCIKLPAMLALQVRQTAMTRGLTISDVVRAALEQIFGQQAPDPAPKSTRIPY